MSQPIRFDDGALYERFMAGWSRLAGEVFLDWLAPPPGLDWLDIGCGNGAFTALLAERCAPARLQGVDPSPGQLAYAQARPGLGAAVFTEGDALALPVPDAAFDAAVMALVVFFLPDPARGVAEMARALRPGGLACAYAWDFAGGGFPAEPLLGVLRGLGHTPPLPPSAGIEQPGPLAALWHGAGFDEVALHRITVRRRYADADAAWDSITASAGTRALIARSDAAAVGELRARLARVLPADPDGSVAWQATAIAIRGRKPG